MSEFYRMNPARWNDGTYCLTRDEEVGLLRICNYYCIHDEAMPTSDRLMAHELRGSTRLARSVISGLLAKGKIKEIDGRWHSVRADFELETRLKLSRTRAETGAKGGRNSGVARQKALKTNDTTQAIASHETKQNRIEENRRDNTPLSPPLRGDTTTSRGTHLPDDWWPADDDWQWGLLQGLDSDQLREITDEFKDYWTAVPGARGRKTQWGRTWRNRVRFFLGSMRKGKSNGQAPRNNSVSQGFNNIRDAIQRRLNVEDVGGGDVSGKIVGILPRLRKGT